MKNRRMKAGEAFVGINRRGSQLHRENQTVSVLVHTSRAGFMDRHGVRGDLGFRSGVTCLLRQNIVAWAPEKNA